MEIKISDLKALFNLVIKKLEYENVEKISINDEDNYWLITDPEWTIFESVPEPVVGSFVDDWNSLERVIQNENPMTYIDFDRLASILHLISEKRNPNKR